MLYELYHVKTSAQLQVMFGLGRKAKFPDEYSMVAKVEADSPEDLYRKTQHGDEGPWWAQTGTLIYNRRVRSTSSGDACKGPDGKVLRFGMNGLESVREGDEKEPPIIALMTEEEMKNNQDHVFVTCVKVENSNPEKVYPGSTQLECERCRAKVWISPGTLESFKIMPNASINCTDCVQEQTQRLKEEQDATGNEEGGSPQPSQGGGGGVLRSHSETPGTTPRKDSPDDSGQVFSDDTSRAENETSSR